MTGRVTGRCHCGEVQVSVISAPAEVTECHCSICRRYAPLWAYYQTGDVQLSGPTDILPLGQTAYRLSPLPPVWLRYGLDAAR